MVLRLCASQEAANYRLPALIMQEAPRVPGGDGGGGGCGGSRLFAETPSCCFLLTHSHAHTRTHTQRLMHKYNKFAASSSRYRTLFLEAALPGGRRFVTLLFITFACAVINPLLFFKQNDYLNNCWFCAAGYLQLSGS